MSEQRLFFRIQQDVQLDYHSVSSDAITQEAPEHYFEHAESLRLFSQFRRMDSESAPLLAQIASESRSLSEYLEMMNRKMDLLAQQLTANVHVETSKESHHVSLSEGGLAFSTDKPVYKDSWLAVQLLFLPSCTGIVTFAKVVRCDELAAQQYRIGIQFHALNQEQSKIIAKQIIHSQMAAKRFDATKM